MVELLKSLIMRYRLNTTDQWHLADLYAKYYGVKFGKNVRITGRVSFGSEAYLIDIGNDVTLTQDVVFHTHDGGSALFRDELPGINVFGPIKIGNNVFIGSHTILLPNVTIGDNVIIGAGSVVSKSIPSNVVAAGVPARPIRTIEEYKTKVRKYGVAVIEENFEKRKKIILDHLNIPSK